MKMTNDTAEDRYRSQLQDLLARMEPTIQSIAESVRRPSGGQNTGELSNAPMHLGDRGTDEYLQDLDATLLVNEAGIAAEIRDALQRLDNGRFGRCERCGNPIPVARLEAIPYARHCVVCAEIEQSQPAANLNIGRPHSPADTFAGQEEMGERWQDRQRSDAEQELAVVGERDGTDVEEADIHAAGAAGGGTAVGGLAGSTVGRGDPDAAAIEDATGSGNFDAHDARQSASRRVSKF